MGAAGPEVARVRCGLDACLSVLGGMCEPRILCLLQGEPRRYGALKRSGRGVSDKVLIQQLKELEAHGIVLRTDYKEVPPRVDYALTPFGRSLVEALAPLCGWGERNSNTIASALANAHEARPG